MKEKERVCFIINPISGVGRQRLLQKWVPKLLDKKRYEFKLVVTKSPGHATELANQAKEEGYSKIVVSGGDGSVNEAARALKGTNVPLCIIPTGSGNGLARDLKIPLKTAKAINILNTGKIQKIDVGTANDRIFVNVAGTGFDAYIADKFAKYGKRGFWSYVKVTLANFRKYKSHKVRIEVEGKILDRTIFSVTIANSRQFGNDAFIAPQAKPDDGFLELVIVNEFPKFLMPWLILRMFMGNLQHSKYYESYRCKDLTLFNSPGVPSHLDGDPYYLDNAIKFGIQKQSLSVWVP